MIICHHFVAVAITRYVVASQSLTLTNEKTRFLVIDIATNNDLFTVLDVF